MLILILLSILFILDQLLCCSYMTVVTPIQIGISFNYYQSVVQQWGWSWIWRLCRMMRSILFVPACNTKQRYVHWL